MSNPFEIPLTDEQLSPQDASWKEILEETDWKELSDEKGSLSEIRCFLEQNLGKDIGTFIDPNTKNPIKLKLSSKHIRAIEGILNLLDHVQDAAANDIGDDKVFNSDESERCEHCHEPLSSYMTCPDGTNLIEVLGCTNPDCDGFDTDVLHG